ncbi:hypothetical protein N7516_000857 [Penicillium verrucosum]|uniref:uncharacterized protein n=1 Tax=Penicillium verrucosum TaxID=60171 RepID=UPI002544D65A|nr:uncharacterized protein N7516_000857 [Penicillium verrucosum]KAJ5940689.1 hypothetical protein N7516_000857 [Penicillium verrucosum]
MARLRCLSSSFDKEIQSKNMLTASSLNLKKIQLILNLEHVVNDNELETVPPVPMPPQSAETLSKVDRETSPRKLETPRTLTLTLLFLARDVVLSRLPDAVQLFSIKIETAWGYGPVSWDGRKYTLTGRPDYGIWYGDRKNLALNTVVVEAKPGEVQLSLAETLACMGCVHRRRQKLKRKDCTIYGLVADDQVFWFLKISQDSKWSERVVTARHRDYEKVLGMLVYFFEKAAAMSPHSKEYGQAHIQEGFEITEIQDSWDMCSID